MYSKFMLEIITSEKQFFIGEVEEIILTSMDGEFGIEKTHHPAVVAIENGILRLRIDGEWKEAACSEGFADIMPHKVLIMVQEINWPENIEIDKVQAEIKKAEEQLRDKRNMLEYKLGKESLARASAKLKVKSRYRSDKL